jgi:hypothetical protein
MFVCLQDALRLYSLHQPANAVAEKGQAWKDLALDVEDFEIIRQMCAVLMPASQMSQKLEGDKYPTASLVLPMTYRLLYVLGDEMPISISGPGGFKLTVSAGANVLCCVAVLLLVLACVVVCILCACTHVLHPNNCVCACCLCTGTNHGLRSEAGEDVIAEGSTAPPH